MAKKSNSLKDGEFKDKEIQELIKKIDVYVEEKKENLSEEINQLVDEKIELKVTKLMKDEEKRYTRSQKFRIFRRDIVILLLLGVVGYFGYCLYKVDYFSLRNIDNTPKTENKDDIKIDDKNDIKVDKPIQDDKHDKDYYIKEYGYLVENLVFDDQDLGKLWQNNMNVKEISEEIKLKIAYHNLHKEQVTAEDEMIRFKAQDLEKALQKVLGEKIELKYEKFKYNNWKFVVYEEMYLGFREDKNEIESLFAIKDAKEKDEKLIFEVVVAVSSENKLYDLDGNLVEDNYKKKDLLDYEDKLKVLQISFQKEQDNYIFDRIKLS